MEQSQQDKRATRRFALQLPISVKYQNGDGKYRVQEIRLGGTKTKLVFD